MPSLGAPTRPQVSWRVSVDRAWRSAQLRRKFEAECGLDPLAENPTDQARQAYEGYTKAYEDRFLLWATKLLGLEQDAPGFIRKELTSSKEVKLG